MPIHDWTRVDAGIFHDFHHSWMSDLKRSLNDGILPPGYYALAERITAGRVPHALKLKGPTNGTASHPDPAKGVSLTTSEPKVRYRLRAEPDLYAAKAKSIAIRHTSDHRVIAIVEIVSPGNKNSQHGLRAFVEKAAYLLRAGVHLMILDLFPPSSRDPQGIHKAIWDEFIENDFTLPADKPLTLASYVVHPWPEAFVEPVAVGDELAEMPLFLAPDIYIPTPLKPTYESAWDAVPVYWRNVIEGKTVHE